jgi:hypothetical protein
MRFASVVFWTAVAIAGCGGSTFTASEGADASAGAAGSEGVGGSGTGGAGTGGSSTTGVGGVSGGSSGGSAGAAGGNQDGGKACTPMPGCSSLTMCNDGCNTCYCSNGAWACTQRACPPPMDAGRADAGQGACNADQDCVFRGQSGCCGMCLATTDPIPPPILCGIACSVVPPGCVCINHKCGTGTVPLGQSCQISHDLCAYGLLCCQQCGGPIRPDAQACYPPVCTQPSFLGMKPGCPPPAP